MLSSALHWTMDVYLLVEYNRLIITRRTDDIHIIFLKGTDDKMWKKDIM